MTFKGNNLTVDERRQSPLPRSTSAGGAGQPLKLHLS